MRALIAAPIIFMTSCSELPQEARHREQVEDNQRATVRDLERRVQELERKGQP